MNSAIRRLDLGYFVRPASETETGAPRVEPVLSYLVRLDDDGLLLFDTGLGQGEEDLDAHYRPHRRGLDEALHDAGVEVADVTMVVNCHLHFDHCGGNGRFPGKPIVVQRSELRFAYEPGYTLPELVDFPGVRYLMTDGEMTLAPGVFVVPTPGHTDGHQSLVVRRDDGTVILAGQAHDFATELAGDFLALRAERDGVPPPLPPHARWLERLLEFDPARIVFAHDFSVFEP
ncbi:MAG TPA: N-acyl homoserine lactonase family protein [Streptosporangiaceae bacterium]|jgi:glyoxylase-like metal-dependent hydrolase (beta-lactamase superfamily II)